MWQKKIWRKDETLKNDWHKPALSVTKYEGSKYSNQRQKLTKRIKIIQIRCHIQEKHFRSKHTDGLRAKGAGRGWSVTKTARVATLIDKIDLQKKTVNGGKGRITFVIKCSFHQKDVTVINVQYIPKLHEAEPDSTGKRNEQWNNGIWRLYA